MQNKAKPWFNSYEQGIPHEINLNQYSSINEIMSRSYNRFPEHPAFHNMGTTFSYRELDQLSTKFASYLQNELGLKKGARVALMMPNILQYPVCLFGILKAGLIAVNINPLYTARELELQLKDCGATAIVLFANSAHVLEKVIKHTELKHIILTEIGDLLRFPKNLVVNFVLKNIKKMVPDFHLPQATSLKEALALGNPAKFNAVTLNHEDIAFLQYTGGTTGVSKGAMLTHGNIIANVLQAKAWIAGTLKEGEEIIITPLPLYHIFSLTANCLIFSSLGALNILITNPRDIPGFVRELKKWKFTAFTGLNTLFNALLNNPEFKKIDFSKLKITLGGGMAVQRPVAERWKEVTKVPLIEAYGLTETSPAVCINPMNIPEYNGFIGLPISSTEVVIQDENEKDLPFLQAGEVCIKGPQVMKGYWNNQSETEKVFSKQGYFKTGDMGYMTEEGFIKLVDRKKDMILVSGFNVYPNEIEEVAISFNKVLEAAAIGIPDDKSGEAIKVFIVKKDPSLTEAELCQHFKENLTGYKIPKHIEFRKDLPKSNVGKILRRELRRT